MLMYSSKTKIDSLFPLNQFNIDCFTSPYILYRIVNGSGIINLYYIASKLISLKSPAIESFFTELNLSKKEFK